MAATQPFRARRFTKLATLLPDSLAPILQQRGLASAALLTEWAEIVGPEIGRISTPLEVRWPVRHAHPEAGAPAAAEPRGTRRPVPAAAHRAGAAEKATLVVACPGAFALDLQMARARIIEAANRRLGFGLIGQVEIRQIQRPIRPPRARPPADDPAAITRFAEAMGDIADEELRQALARFAARAARRAGSG